MRALPNHDTGAKPPEVKPAEVEAVDDVAVQRAEVAEVAANADVIVEESHRAHAEVVAEAVVRRRNVKGRSAVDLRPDQTKAARDKRTEAGPEGAADGDPDDDVPHQIDDAVVAEIGFGSE